MMMHGLANFKVIYEVVVSHRIIAKLFKCRLLKRCGLARGYYGNPSCDRASCIDIYMSMGYYIIV
jgi:hypothetical protein